MTNEIFFYRLKKKYYENLENEFIKEYKLNYDFNSRFYLGYVMTNNIIIRIRLEKNIKNLNITEMSQIYEKENFIHSEKELRQKK